MKQIGKRRAAWRPCCMPVFFWLQHVELSKAPERRAAEFGLQWAKARRGEKKGLLVIIKSSHTDFLPNLFPQGP